MEVERQPEERSSIFLFERDAARFRPLARWRNRLPSVSLCIRVFLCDLQSRIKFGERPFASVSQIEIVPDHCMTVARVGEACDARFPEIAFVLRSRHTEWGYGVSGPAQLSLALLADALGDEELAQ